MSGSTSAPGWSPAENLPEFSVLYFSRVISLHSSPPLDPDFEGARFPPQGPARRTSSGIREGVRLCMYKLQAALSHLVNIFFSNYCVLGPNGDTELNKDPSSSAANFPVPVKQYLVT